jgi:hypothetical protein
MRRFGSFRRRSLQIAGLLLITAAVSLTSLADAALVPPSLTNFGPWATKGSQVKFVATVRKQAALWTEKFGSNTPKRIALADCGGLGELDQLAVGPKGSVACLDVAPGTDVVYYSLALVSSSGAVKHVASAGGSTGPVDSIPFVFGDSTFLGYLHVTADGVVQLMRITSSGHAQHVADLAGISNPQAVAIDSGHIFISDLTPSLGVSGHGYTNSGHVYTVAGQHISTFDIATIAAGAPIGSGPFSVTIRKNRIVALYDKRLSVYTLHGQRVHSYPVNPKGAGWPATYYGYVVYIRAGNAVHALKLSNGKDRIVARAEKGWFGNGLSLQAPGAVAPLTLTGDNLHTKLVFIPMSKIRATVG